MLEFNFHPFPTLKTERLVLREMTKDDAPELFQLRSSKEVMKYIDRPIAVTIQDSLDLIQRVEDGLKNNEAIGWAITLKGEDKLIGHIGFHRIQKEHHRAEIGYVLSPQYHGKGIMQEAITAVLNYGFVEMKLHSIEANVNPANDASMKLLERNQFVREAFYKENYYFNGKFLDTAIYSLLTPVK